MSRGEGGGGDGGEGEGGQEQELQGPQAQQRRDGTPGPLDSRETQIPLCNISRVKL